MRIPLKFKDEKHKFVLLIEMYNPVLGLKRREKEVLLHFLLKYRELHLKGLTYELITNELFSTTVRQEVREKVKMSEPSFNNHIHQLKNKGILVEGKLIKVLATVVAADDEELEYKLIQDV